MFILAIQYENPSNTRKCIKHIINNNEDVEVESNEHIRILREDVKVLKKENNIIRNKVNKLENEISNLKSKPSNNLFSNVSFCQNNVLLYFCIFIPEIGKLNKVRNVIKKIYNGIRKFIPEFIEINYNIFQTFGECEKYFWYNDSGICFYKNPKLCKKSKLIYTITDIRNILLKFLDEKDNDFFIPDTILSKYYEIIY